MAPEDHMNRSRQYHLAPAMDDPDRRPAPLRRNPQVFIQHRTHVTGPERMQIQFRP
jgi:hypothetical protein